VTCVCAGPDSSASAQRGTYGSQRTPPGAVDIGKDLLPLDLELQLRQVFARGQDIEHSGLTPGFLQGKQHQQLVIGRNPRHRGVCLGRWGHRTFLLHL
jgi:hypothetical protein